MDMEHERRELTELVKDIGSLGITVTGGPPVNLDGPLAAHLIKLGWRKPLKPEQSDPHYYAALHHGDYPPNREAGIQHDGDPA